MKYIFSVIISCFFAFSLLGQGIDARCTQNGQSACIDWDRRVVIAKGIGAPSSKATNPATKRASAIRAARLDASRNLLEMLQGINLSGSTTMRDAMIESDLVRSEVRGKVNGLRSLGNPRYFADGTVEVMMEARMQQTIPQELVERLTKDQAQSMQQTTISIQPPQEVRKQAQEPGTQASPSKPENQIYSGLVLDASGVELQPAIYPTVLDEDGKEVYGSGYADREFSIKFGLAGYVKTLEQAEQNDRVMGNPLVIKVLKTSGKRNVDIVISNEDAQRLRKIAKAQTFLREARVVIALE